MSIHPYNVRLFQMSIDQLFYDDELRDKLVNLGKLKEFKKSYKLKRRLKNLNTGRFWDKKFSNKEKTRDWMAEDRIRTAIKLIPRHSKEALDIGIGKGNLEILLSKLKPSLRLHGIDIASHRIKTLKAQIKGKFKTGSIYKIPFAKKFDVVIVLEVLEHLPPNRVFTAYKEIRKVLKEKGVSIFSVPINEQYSSKYNPNAHLRKYTPKLFKKELKLGGFRVEKEQTLFAFSKLYKLKTFLAHKILKNRWKPNVIIVRARKI